MFVYFFLLCSLLYKCICSCMCDYWLFVIFNDLKIAICSVLHVLFLLIFFFDLLQSIALIQIKICIDTKSVWNALEWYTREKNIFKNLFDRKLTINYLLNFFIVFVLNCKWHFECLNTKSTKALVVFILHVIVSTCMLIEIRMFEWK